MTDNSLIEKINNSALALLQIDSLTRLHIAIVKEALELSQLSHGILFIQEQGKLKKAYSSFAPLKISRKNYLEKALRTHTVVQQQKETLQTIQPELVSHGITSEIFIPLIAKKQVLGILLLYTTEANSVTKELIIGLQLFGSLATIALKKALLQEESKKALETRDQFISLASHELRTPLTSINGYIQLLHRKMANQDSQEARWVQELYIESIRMTGLVKELLDVNRIKQGQFAFIFNEVSLYDVVKMAIKRYRLTHADHPIVFENPSSDHKYSVIGDFDKLVEMVSGLLSNAIKFSKPESKIIVSLITKPRVLSIIVQDFGKGMSKQDLTTIFEGFYKSKHPGTEGMGVGLLLAKHIVTHHRGKIHVSSKKDKGTIVEVTLPAVKF
jgi:signal transduction histidine kinase